MTVEDYAEILHQRKDLTMGAKAMMFDLIMIWNDQHEKGIDLDGWFTARDRGEGEYVIGENISSRTYAKYRKELIEKGCIEYERASGGYASGYKILL